MNKIIKEIIETYTQLKEVKSIAFGGSSTAKTFDNNSDIDIYIFTTTNIPIATRENIVKNYSSQYEVGGEYFGSGDEFYVDKIQRQLDVMFWNINWFEDVINNTWFKHYPSNGYSTAFLYTLSNCEIVYDNNNWLLNLKNSISTPYPEELRENIIKRNIMLLKDKPFASYYEQIQKAIIRNDINSINHRICAFLSSYYDIIFAINYMLHPGEKRLIKYIKDNCKIIPKNFEENIEQLLIQPNNSTLIILDNMVKEIKSCITKQ